MSSYLFIVNQESSDEDEMLENCKYLFDNLQLYLNFNIIFWHQHLPWTDLVFKKINSQTPSVYKIDKVADRLFYYVIVFSCNYIKFQYIIILLNHFYYYIFYLLLSIKMFHILIDIFINITIYITILQYYLK